MTIKTNVNTPYDRVEWRFLEAIMQKLGFHHIWIQRIMTCVSSFCYSVLINGVPFGNFTPSRGIRQDDSLSPYLFLLCAEVLSQPLDRAQFLQNFQGVKLARNCPKVTHSFLLMIHYSFAGLQNNMHKVWLRF